MQDEANIVKQYEEANVSGRIEIFIKYYPNFIRLVEGYEQSLSFIIKEEKLISTVRPKENSGYEFRLPECQIRQQGRLSITS